MRIALVTPVPPSSTGIADYSRLLLQGLTHLRPEWTLDVFSETETPDVGHRFQVRSLSEFPENASNKPDLALYQMGNSRHHDRTYPLVFHFPGVLVLHDLVLHHARLAFYLDAPEVRAYREDMGNVDKRDRAQKRLEAYAAEVEAAYPGRGTEVAEIALRMGGGRFFYAYPLYELLVRASKMTLVHGPSAREQVEARVPEAVVRTVRMGVALPTPLAREEARRRLGLGKELLVASFGLVTPEKRIVTALRALKRLVDAGLEVRYVLVGGTVAHFDPLAEARELGIADRVSVTGRVSEEMFSLYAFAADLCLNLRYPSAGETSATLLRLLAAGRAVVITDQVHHFDLPPSVVFRAPLAGDEDGLYCDLVDALTRPERRRDLESRARDFIEREHTIEVMAHDYVRALEEAVSLPPPSKRSRLPAHLL